MSARAIKIDLTGDSGSAQRAIRRTNDELGRLDKSLDATERRLSVAASGLFKLGAINALAGLSGQVMTLTAALAPATAGIAALPAFALAAGAAFATVKVATAGMGDAFKAVAEGDAEKLSEALKGLAPAAQSFVKTYQGIAESFKGVQSQVQQTMFSGLDADLKALATKAMPVVQSGLVGIAGAMNQVGRETLQILSTNIIMADLRKIMFGTSNAISLLRPGIVQFTAGMVALGAVGMPVLNRFTEFVSNGLRIAGVWLQSAEGAEKMSQVLDRAGDALASIWRISVNVGKGLVSVFSATDSGNMLADLERITAQFSAWASSAQGQQTLSSIFTAMNEAFSNMVQVIPPVAAAIGLVFTAFNSLPGPVRETVAQFAAWAIVLGPVLKLMAAGSVAIKGMIGLYTGLSAAASSSAALTARIWLLYQLEAAKAAIATGVARAQIIGHWIAMQVQAGASAVRMGAAWLLGVVTSGVSAVASMAVSSARIVAGWVVMGTQSLIQGARMAAAWVIALGPVAWVIAALAGVAFAIYKNWDTITAKTDQAWSWVSGKVSGAMSSVKTSVSEGISSAVSWISGLPNRATVALANIGQTLYHSGQQLIQGLINGIGYKFEALKEKVRAAAQLVKDFWPFSPAKTGPLSGRGDLRYSGESMMKQIGTGIDRGTPKLAAAATRAAGSVSDAMTPTGQFTGTATRASTAAGYATPSRSSRPVNYSPTWNIDLHGGDEAMMAKLKKLLEDHDEELIRLINQGVSA